MRKIHLKALRGLSPREMACSVSQCFAFNSNSESYCIPRSRGYFNCLTTGELFKLDGLLLLVSVSQIAVFALRDQGPRTLPLDLPLG